MQKPLVWVGVTSGSFTGFEVAAPQQKFGGERKDKRRSPALVAQMGKDRGSTDREGVDVVLGDAAHGWAWQCGVHG